MKNKVSSINSKLSPVKLFLFPPIVLAFFILFKFKNNHSEFTFIVYMFLAIGIGSLLFLIYFTKTIRIEKDKIVINFIFRFKTYNYSIQELKFHCLKTHYGKGKIITYNQFIFSAENKNVTQVYSFTDYEFTNFNQLIYQIIPITKNRDLHSIETNLIPSFFIVLISLFSLFLFNLYLNFH